MIWNWNIILSFIKKILLFSLWLIFNFLNCYDIDYDDEEDKDDPDGKNRSSRGLRVLSLKVKDIVCEKKRTSYKEVAESLI